VGRPKFVRSQVAQLAGIDRARACASIARVKTVPLDRCARVVPARRSLAPRGGERLAPGAPRGHLSFDHVSSFRYQLCSLSVLVQVVQTFGTNFGALLVCVTDKVKSNIQV
jgi:hypothetical protein